MRPAAERVRYRTPTCDDHDLRSLRRQRGVVSRGLPGTWTAVGHNRRHRNTASTHLYIAAANFAGAQRGASVVAASLNEGVQHSGSSARSPRAGHRKSLGIG